MELDMGIAMEDSMEIPIAIVMGIVYGNCHRNSHGKQYGNVHGNMHRLMEICHPLPTYWEGGFRGLFVSCQGVADFHQKWVCRCECR